MKDLLGANMVVYIEVAGEGLESRKFENTWGDSVSASRTFSKFVYADLARFTVQLSNDGGNASSPAIYNG